MSKLIPLSLIILITLSLFSCKQKTEIPITGKWKNKQGTIIEFKKNNTLKIGTKKFKYSRKNSVLYWHTPQMTLEYYCVIEKDKLTLTSVILKEKIVYYKIHQ